MLYLTLGDLKLILEDLFKKHHLALNSCKAGEIYEPLLRNRFERLSAIPNVLIRERPLAEELDSADIRHDSGATRLRNTTKAAIDDPLTEPEIREAAERIQRDLIPSLSITKASYATEAANAKERRKLLDERASDLKLFPLPGGKTLYDAAVQFLDAGEEIGELLSARATVEATNEQDRSEIVLLRGELIGLLGRLKQTLADEMESNASLPRDLSIQLFAYAEQLNDSRYTQYQASQANKSNKKASEDALTKGGS